MERDKITSKPNDTATKEDLSTSSAKKPAYESRKSAEELKLRLASAVSAKIASGKDGRNSRSIGYLLQRKEQQENRLNTKDISFQKPVRNDGGKIEKNEGGLGKGNSVRSGMSKTDLQKSLLSALMSSRTPSGASSRPGKDTTASSRQNKDTGALTNSKIQSVASSGQKEDSGALMNTKTPSGASTKQKKDITISSGQNKGTTASRTTKIPSVGSSGQKEGSNVLMNGKTPSGLSVGQNKGAVASINRTIPSAVNSGQNKDNKALMNSKMPSGARSRQNRDTDALKTDRIASGTDSGLIKGTVTLINGRTAFGTRSGQNKLAGDLMNGRTLAGASSGEKKEASFPLSNGSSSGSKLSPSSTIKGKTGTNDNNRTSDTKSDNGVSKTQVDTGASGSVVEKAKNIQNLLGQRKQDRASLGTTVASKDFALHGNSAATKPLERAGKAEGNPMLNARNANSNKTLDKVVKTTGKSNEENTKSEADFVFNKTATKVQSFQGAGNGGNAALNGKNNGKLSFTSANKPFENAGKKSPPPIAKKPSRDLLRTASRQDNLGQQSSAKFANGDKISSKSETKFAAKRNSPPNQRRTTVFKANGLNPEKETVSTEDLLEKLEAGVGSCKIAAFQSIEDFSALRMKVYRIRGQLDELKRDRERRAPLVC